MCCSPGESVFISKAIGLCMAGCDIQKMMYSELSDQFLLTAGLLDFVCHLSAGSLLQPVPERLSPSHEALAWAGMQSSQDTPEFVWHSLHFTGVSICYSRMSLA